MSKPTGTFSKASSVIAVIICTSFEGHWQMMPSCQKGFQVGKFLSVILQVSYKFCILLLLIYSTFGNVSFN